MARATTRRAKGRPLEPRRRTGGRSARVVRDVLAATLDELAAVGYANLSIEAVASRAGVNRTTVYRRWPMKADLVRTALLGILGERPPPPNSGSIRGDIVEILGRLREQSPRNLGLTRALMADIADPEVAAIARTIGAQHQSGLVAVVARGIERGELPRGTEPQRVVEPIVATFFMRMSMMGGGPAGPEEVGRIVDLVLDGARSGAAVARRGSQ